MALRKLACLSLLAPGLLLISGCSPLSAYNTLQAPGLKPDFRDLSYGPQERQKLDLYLPAGREEPAPLLVWFYGGGWNSGDKADYAFVARRFTDMGYAVAIPDYRLAPAVRFPGFVEDGAAALAMLRGFAERHAESVSTRPLVLAGHSAGAYIAVQMVADADFLASVGMARGEVAGIIGIAGPYDFHPYQVAASRSAFGDAPPEASQPVEQDLSTMPPLLLITGASDATVKPRNSKRLAELAPQAQLEVVAGLGHIGALLALGPRITTKPAVIQPIEGFLGKLGGTAAVSQASGLPLGAE